MIDDWIVFGPFGPFGPFSGQRAATGGRPYEYREQLGFGGWRCCAMDCGPRFATNATKHIFPERVSTMIPFTFG